MNRSRRNLIVIAAVVAVVIAAGSAAAIAVGFGGGEGGTGGGDGDGGGEITEGGPLAGQAAGGATASGAPVALDKPYSWGESSIINETDEPVTIERLELLEVPEGLRVLGMYALPGEETGIGMAEGYDPDSWPQIPGLRDPARGDVRVHSGLRARQARTLPHPGRSHLLPGRRRALVVTLNRAVRWCGPIEVSP